MSNKEMIEKKVALFTQSDLDAAVRAERERCAKVCELRGKEMLEYLGTGPAHAYELTMECANDIRSLVINNAGRNMKTVKYLKTWMGMTSGAFAGRDDGYPERRFALIDSLDSLVSTFDSSADYYRLEPIDVSTVVQAAKDLHYEP